MEHIKVDSEVFEKIISRLDRLEKKVVNVSNKAHCLDKFKWLDSQEMCEMFKISKRSLQNYRTARIIPYSHLGDNKSCKCVYNATLIEKILLDNHVDAIKVMPKSFKF